VRSVRVLTLLNRIFCAHRDMSMNHIKHLPETLFQSTKNLVLLHLYGNKIEVFPKSIFKDLSLLEDLDLSANSLLEISSDIFRGVTSLKRLKLQENQLQQLPLGKCEIYCDGRKVIGAQMTRCYNMKSRWRCYAVVLRGVWRRRVLGSLIAEEQPHIVYSSRAVQQHAQIGVPGPDRKLDKFSERKVILLYYRNRLLLL